MNAKINPHIWRKFKHAERRMLKFVLAQTPCHQGRNKRRWNKWMNQLSKWQRKLLKEVMNKHEH